MKDEEKSTEHAPNIDISPVRRRGPKSKSVETKKEERKTKVYYCNKGQYSFQIPEYETDEFGEVIVKNGVKKQLITTDANGNNPVRVTKEVKFERFPVIDPKTNKTDATKNVGRLVIKGDDPYYDEKVAGAEQGCDTPICGVVTEDTYRKTTNHASYIAEEKAKSLEASNKEKDKEIDELKSMLKKQGVEV